MTFKYYLIAFLTFSQAVPFQGICREYHVNRTIGSDQNKGDAQHPLKPYKLPPKEYNRAMRSSYIQAFTANKSAQYGEGQKSNLSSSVPHQEKRSR